MIHPNEKKREMTPKSVVQDVEAKRLADIAESAKTGAKLVRKLVGKTIFPAKKKRNKWY